MTTIIHSLGTSWRANGVPCTIEELLGVLGRETLDPSFEDFGNFAYPSERGTGTTFFGNFLNLSHVFNIDSDEPELVASLGAAIRANQQRPEYVTARERRLGMMTELALLEEDRKRRRRLSGHVA